MTYYVYILANKSNRVLYTGVTNDLIRRMYEHRNHVDPDSFTAKYHVTKLVYFEDTKQRRGTRCALDDRMIRELESVLGKANVVIK